MLFGKFTERTQEVLVKAQKESKDLKHGYVGTEHILLGILLSKGFAKDCLENQDISYEVVKKIMENFLGKGEKELDVEGGELLLTPRTKTLFDEALEVAKKLGHNYVTPEHLVIAILNSKEGVAYTILITCKIDNDKIQKEIIDFLEEVHVEREEEFPIKSEKIKSEPKTPILNKYGRDLTKMAEENKLDPVIGRDIETQRVLEILCRRIKNNPCLIGEPGVGKTAVIEGLAQKIINGNIPSILNNTRLIALDITSMIAGAKYRGEFEERLKKVIDEIRNNDNIIVFIDEIHTIVGAGGAEGAIDASNILKPSLARGEVKCIGATTNDEYRKHIEKDPALERRFQPVKVIEPTEEETLDILYGIRAKYELHHGVKISDKALKIAIELSNRYITDRYMPDKAIDLIDEAAARVRITKLESNVSNNKTIIEMQVHLNEVIENKQKAISNKNFEEAAALRLTQKEIEKEIEESKSEKIIEDFVDEYIVDEDSIANVVSSWTNIPINKITEKESEKLLNLEALLHKKVIGQNEAVTSVAKAVKRARVGLKDPNRPIGSFIFCGPTGVGKTELSNSLAEVMFGDRKNLIRIDMSEYMEKHSVSRIIGSPPGYQGYEEGGQLTEAIRRAPYSVILLDEVEKAHQDVLNILLQIMDDGKLTDGKGRVVDFKNTILIMTSNIGAKNITSGKQLGFTVYNEINNEYEGMKKTMMEEIKRSFSPEFLNRVDDIIIFHKLIKDDYIKILDIMLQSIKSRLQRKNINLKFNEESKEFLINKGIDYSYGARPLRRILIKELEDRLSDELLKGSVKAGDTIEVISNGETLIFKHA